MASASVLAFPAPPHDPGNYGLFLIHGNPLRAVSLRLGKDAWVPILCSQALILLDNTELAQQPGRFPSCSDGEKDKGSCGFQARRKVPFLVLLPGARVASPPRRSSSKGGHTWLLEAGPAKESWSGL